MTKLEFQIQFSSNYQIFIKYSLNISFPKDSSVNKPHNSLSSSFPTNNHLPTSFFFSSVSPIKHQRLRLLHTPAEPTRLTSSSELNNKNVALLLLRMQYSLQQNAQCVRRPSLLHVGAPSMLPAARGKCIVYWSLYTSDVGNILAQ